MKVMGRVSMTTLSSVTMSRWTWAIQWPADVPDDKGVSFEYEGDSDVDKNKKKKKDQGTKNE